MPATTAAQLFVKCRIDKTVASAIIQSASGGGGGGGAQRPSTATTTLRGVGLQSAHAQLDNARH